MYARIAIRKNERGKTENPSPSAHRIDISIDVIKYTQSLKPLQFIMVQVLIEIHDNQ